MNTEYWTEKIYTKKELADGLLAISKLLLANNEGDVDTLIDTIKATTIGALITKISSTSPLIKAGVSGATVIYDLYKVLDNEYMSTSVHVITNGYNALNYIYDVMNDGNYSHAKVDLAVCDVEDTVQIIEGADMIALRPAGSTGWVTV